jgi:small GTP-binding protein
MTELAQQLIEREKQERSGYLDLGRCGLTEMPDLSTLYWLQTLIVSDDWFDSEGEWVRSRNTGGFNRFISNPPADFFPKELKQLRLGGARGENWNVSDGRFLEKLTSLTTLDLRYNQLSDGRFLEKLTSLTTLYLSSNKISDGRFLEKLTSLTSLDLSSNKISDGRFLEKLISLTTLYLRDNQISDGRFLEKFISLTTLDLSFNQINDGCFLEKLTSLTTLYLPSNQISDGRFLEKLTNLTTLDLSFNKIKDYSFLEKLTSLTTLYLRSNQNSNGRFLEKLTNLTTLDLSFNKINDYSFLEKLISLTTLYLRSNQISNGRFLEKLTSLTTIDLSDNQLSDLGPLLNFIQAKKMKLVWNEWGLTSFGEINVLDNPFSNPPLEIVKAGNEAIFRYFEKFKNRASEEIRFVDEAKVLLIGQPRAGKTTLRKKLYAVESDMPKDEETTRGIDIQCLDFTFADAEKRIRTFKFNVWDFGGQEIYHATHRFFLTTRSLYIAVVNTDVNDKQNDLDYWLHIVELLGGSSPILMVQNQKNNRKIEVSKNLKGRFEHLLKKEYKLDLSKLNPNEAIFEQERLDDFRQFEEELRVMLRHMPQTSIRVTQEELFVREAIAERGKTEPVISKEDFFNLCGEKGLHDPALQKDFLRLLHELGALLHFEKNEHLERVVILQNKWATDAVFKILDAPKIALQNGLFTKRDSEIVWDSPEYRGKEVELRALMREFKLCYQIGETDRFIAPQLLSPNPPKHYQWNTTESDLRMVVEYEFMPRGIMTQFIVEMHREIADEQQLVWQTGMVVQPKDLTETRAEASESYDNRRIEITVQGPYAGILLQRLVDALRKIHDSYQNLEPDELLPCICPKCQPLLPEQRHHFKYKSLLNSLYINHVDEKQCDKSDLPVPIEKILGQAGFGKKEQTRDAQRLLDMHNVNLNINLENRDFSDRLERIAEKIDSVETNTFLIQSNQGVHTHKLNDIIQFAKTNEAQVQGLFEQIDALPEENSVDLERINDLLDERFGSLLEKLPLSHEIVREWKQANAKLPHEADSKWKLKFKLPFIIGELEKEFAWDGKVALRHLRSEILAFSKGEKGFRDLFLED